MLGTVQFGMPYGIANRRGQPSHADVREIVRYGYEHGVTALDTAAAYGTSEEVLGAVLAELGLQTSMTIVSKIAPIAANTDAEAESCIIESITRSLRRLGLEQLPVCLIHREDDVRFLPLLAKMVTNGLIGAYGVSLDSQRFLVAAQAAPFIQLPYNLFDRRFTNFIAGAGAAGTTIVARSVYLQGLLLMPAAEIVQPTLRTILPLRHALQSLAAENNISMAELCVRYVLANDNVTSLVMGVDTVSQLQDNICLLERGPLSAVLLKKIADLVPELPEEIVRPARWT